MGICNYVCGGVWSQHERGRVNHARYVTKCHVSCHVKRSVKIVVAEFCWCARYDIISSIGIDSANTNLIVPICHALTVLESSARIRKCKLHFTFKVYDVSYSARSSDVSCILLLYDFSDSKRCRRRSNSYKVICRHVHKLARHRLICYSICYEGRSSCTVATSAIVGICNEYTRSMRYRDKACSICSRSNFEHSSLCSEYAVGSVTIYSITDWNVWWGRAIRDVHYRLNTTFKQPVVIFGCKISSHLVKI